MSIRELLERTDLRRLRSELDVVGESAVEAALGRSSATFADFLTLLSPCAAAYLEPMAERARRITLQRFGRVILMYAPLYLSNACTNACSYCGFNVHRKTARIVLDEPSILAEAGVLHRAGFRHVLLVTGEAPSVFSVDHLAAALRCLAPQFSSLSLEVQPLTTEQYREMADAGADGLTLYQETYDRDVYASVHPAGRKRDYDYRIEAIGRAGEAGLRRLGIGALLGLHDARSEAIALALHADYLMKHYWRSQVSISFPRLRLPEDSPMRCNPVSDATLVQLLLALRIYLHDVGLVMSTRESSSFRDCLIPLGLTQMSAGSRTEPGGYLHPSRDAVQFEVEDCRSPSEVARAIRAAGYEPVWKDWDRLMHEGKVDAGYNQRKTERRTAEFAP